MPYLLLLLLLLLSPLLALLVAPVAHVLVHICASAVAVGGAATLARPRLNVRRALQA